MFHDCYHCDYASVHYNWDETGNCFSDYSHTTCGCEGMVKHVSDVMGVFVSDFTIDETKIEEDNKCLYFRFRNIL
jgi:hypothetical protein